MERDRIMESKNHLSVSFIGAGNAAFRLSLALKYSGIIISGVWNRGRESADFMAKILNKRENNPSALPDTMVYDEIYDCLNSNIVIIAVSDDFIPDIIEMIKLRQEVLAGEVIICHVSGSQNISIFGDIPNHGVIYPLMTLSKSKPVDFKIVPFLIEASNEKSLNTIEELINSLKSEYSICSSNERLKLHLAAVYVNNFVNYILSMAYEISPQHHVFLLPLATETVRKAFLKGDPFLTQTGPAVRDDNGTIEKHLNLINECFDKNKNPHEEVYRLFTALIKEKFIEYKDNVKF